jgi:hypothetical protein
VSFATISRLPGIEVVVAAAGRPAEFVKSDGTTNVTQRVREAFWDEGIPVIVVGVAEGEAPDLQPPLTAEQVKEMLDTKGDWKLAVDVDSDTREILTKKDLQDQIALQGDVGMESVATVVLRPIAPGEKLLADAIPKLYGLDVSYDRLKESLSLPVAQAALVATGAGLFGLLALRDKISHPDAMKWAIILAAVAVGTSLVGRYWLREVTLKPARLDLVKERYEESIRGPLWRSRAGIVLLLGAIGLALHSTWPSESTTAAKATIATPTSTQTAEGIAGQVKVSWKNLGDEVAKIRTVVQTGGATVVTQTSPKATDGTAESEIPFKLDKPATIAVATTPIDSAGAAAGTASSKEFSVP